MSNTSHEENIKQDFAPGMAENQYIRHPTLKEINETLSFKYMFKHEPFEELPRQYYPQKHYNHRPPIFDWGIELTEEDLEKLGLTNGWVTGEPPFSCTQIGYLISQTIDMFNEKHRLDLRTWVDISRPISKRQVVLLKAIRNYGTVLSPDAVIDLCEDMETTLGKRGKWYISDSNKSLQDDYYISLPEKKTKETTESQSTENGNKK